MPLEGVVGWSWNARSDVHGIGGRIPVVRAARAAASFKDLANRYLRARTEGFACKRRVEAKDAGAARAFKAGQAGNFLGSILLISAEN
jgi:hypothetical protein